LAVRLANPPLYSFSFTALFFRTCNLPAFCRQEREVREAHEKEEKELQMLMEMEEEKRKQQEYAAEQVHNVVVSTVILSLFRHPSFDLLVREAVCIIWGRK